MTNTPESEVEIMRKMLRAAKVIAIATGKPMIRQINVVSAATARLFRNIER